VKRKTKKLKVLLVVRWPVGGIRTFMRYFYRNFDAERWEFTILAPDLDELRALMDDLAGLHVNIVPVKGMATDGSSGVWKMFRGVAGQVIKGKFDLVHSHGFTSGMCAAVPAFLRSTPHLMTSHDILNERQFAGARGVIKKMFMRLLFGMIDSIHSVSYDAQRNLLSNFPGLNTGKCFTIPNGIEMERFENAKPRDVRGELGVGGDVFLIGFLGRFMAQKGFSYLVDAIEILSRDQALARNFSVVSFGDGGFIREEKEAIKARNLDRYFSFMPFVANVAGTIKGLDVVAMPSLWEACGLLAMETLVSGTPLIGTDCIGLREVLKFTPARIVSPKDGKDLALAIKREMEHPSKAEALAFQNEAAVRFDVRKRAVELEGLYKRIVQSRDE